MKPRAVQSAPEGAVDTISFTEVPSRYVVAVVAPSGEVRVTTRPSAS